MPAVGTEHGGRVLFGGEPTMQNRKWVYCSRSPLGKLDKAWDEAIAKGWIVRSTKDDWKTIFPSAATKQEGFVTEL